MTGVPRDNQKIEDRRTEYSSAYGGLAMTRILWPKAVSHGDSHDVTISVIPVATRQ